MIQLIKYFTLAFFANRRDKRKSSKVDYIETKWLILRVNKYKANNNFNAEILEYTATCK